MAGIKCLTCIHNDRGLIEQLLVDGVTSVRGMAKRFKVSRSSLWRHKRRHLPAASTMESLRLDAEQLVTHIARLEARAQRAERLLADMRARYRNLVYISAAARELLDDLTDITQLWRTYSATNEAGNEEEGRMINAEIQRRKNRRDKRSKCI